MSIFVSWILIIVFVFLGFISSMPQVAIDKFNSILEVESITSPTLVEQPGEINVTAQSSLVVDGYSNKVLFSKDHLKQVPIASITKLITALVFLDHNPGWNTTVVIQEEDYRPGNQVYLIAGEEVTIKDLFHLSLIASSNEATIALARATGLENFIEMMNFKASQLGMGHTKLFDPTGLDPRNSSTASDLVKLAQVAFNNTDISRAASTSKYLYTIVNNDRQGYGYSTNYLLTSSINTDNYEIIGGKTGYLDEAGYCLLFAVKHNDQTLYISLLGSESGEDRWQDAVSLVKTTLGNYSWPEPIE